jgi:hypothetical protein
MKGSLEGGGLEAFYSASEMTFFSRWGWLFGPGCVALAAACFLKLRPWR